MARPLRLDASGMTHHITSRGNERKRIFRDERDCEKFLSLLEETVRRFGWIVHASRAPHPQQRSGLGSRQRPNDLRLENRWVTTRILA
jgi:hypothetical protein